MEVRIGLGDLYCLVPDLSETSSSFFFLVSIFSYSRRESYRRWLEKKEMDGQEEEQSMIREGQLIEVKEIVGRVRVTQIMPLLHCGRMAGVLLIMPIPWQLVIEMMLMAIGCRCW